MPPALPTAEPAPPSGLASRVAAERRESLEQLIAHGVDDSDVPAVTNLLQDPERDLDGEILLGLADVDELSFHSGFTLRV